MAPSPMQLIIVLVIVLLLFGAKKIPELAKGLGTGMREFRQGASGEIENDGEENKENKDSKESQGSRADASADDESGEAKDDRSRDAQGSDQSADKTEQRS